MRELTPEFLQAADIESSTPITIGAGATFTPGEWHACSANDGACSCGLVWSKTADVPVLQAYTDQDRRFPEEVPFEQRVANVHLAAAAPDLLAACQLLPDFDIEDPDAADFKDHAHAFIAAMRAARAAIKKALRTK